jgi:uncharacterized membrane protein YfcA
VLVGAAMQSATGFGLALASSPALVAVLGPRAAVSAMAVLALLVTVLILAGERRRPRADAREVVALVSWTVPGLLVGTVVLRVVPEHALKILVLAAVLLAVALRLRGPARERRWSHRRSAATGVTSGVLATSTGIGGPPLVFHLLARRMPAELMRDTLTMVFLVGGVLSAGALIATGTFSLPAEMPLLVAATLAGQVVGRRIFPLLDGDRYERTVLAVLVVTAVIALGASVT